jgi:hypothetical protein
MAGRSSQTSGDAGDSKSATKQNLGEAAGHNVPLRRSARMRNESLYLFIPSLIFLKNASV